MTKYPVVHFDLSTQNNQESADFYQSTFGWEHQTAEDVNYTMFETQNGGGGFIRVGENGVQQGDIVIFIGSEDIDADLAKVESNGGTRLTDRMDMPGYGSMAYFSDPSGNKIGLWKSESE